MAYAQPRCRTPSDFRMLARVEEFRRSLFVVGIVVELGIPVGDHLDVIWLV